MKNKLKKTYFCSLKKTYQYLQAVEWRICIDSPDSVTLLEQTSLCVTYCVTSLICLTYKVAIRVTYDKWCQRSLWRQLKRFNGDSWQYLPFWANCINILWLRIL